MSYEIKNKQTHTHTKHNNSSSLRTAMNSGNKNAKRGGDARAPDPPRETQLIIITRHEHTTYFLAGSACCCVNLLLVDFLRVSISILPRKNTIKTVNS